jgi:heavy-metal resistance protein
MKVKVLIGALVVLMLMNVAALGSFLFLHLHARHQGNDRARYSHRWVMRNVPAKDRDTFFNTMRSIHDDVHPLAEDTGKLEDELIRSMRKDPVPRAHIDSLLEEISKNRLEIARRATDRMIAMGDSLTPDERGHMVDAMMRFRHLGRQQWRVQWTNDGRNTDGNQPGN